MSRQPGWVCKVIDLRDDSVFYNPTGWCPPGGVEPHSLHVLSLENPAITVRGCPPKGTHPEYPYKQCAVPSEHMGWCGNTGRADMWCETVEGVASPVVPLEVPEPGLWLGFAVALGTLWLLALLAGHKRKRA